MTYITHPVQQAESYPMGNADGSHLSDLEREWLESVPTEGWSLASKSHVDFMNDTRTPAQKASEWTPARLTGQSMIIVYRGEFGIAMGAVRCRRIGGKNGWTEDAYEASPFPGGWETVSVSRILLVRHPATI